MKRSRDPAEPEERTLALLTSSTTLLVLMMYKSRSVRKISLPLKGSWLLVSGLLRAHTNTRYSPLLTLSQCEGAGSFRTHTRPIRAARPFEAIHHNFQGRPPTNAEASRTPTSSKPCPRSSISTDT